MIWLPPKAQFARNRSGPPYRNTPLAVAVWRDREGTTLWRDPPASTRLARAPKVHTRHRWDNSQAKGQRGE